MEIFDVVDENGRPTGDTVERSIAHRDGIPHRTAHVWIVKRVEDKVYILLQKRCLRKDSFPGCYDISSAGHIPAGVDYIPSAVRELKEELGIEVNGDELIDCGGISIEFHENFHGKPFNDIQYSRVYLLWKDMDESEFMVQKEEIDSVKWMEFEECKKGVINHSFDNCILIKELLLIEKKF